MFCCYVLLFYLKDVAHDAGCLAALELAVIVKIVKISAEKGVADDLDVLLLIVEVLLVEGAHDVRAEGGVDKDRLVDLADVVAGREGTDGLKHAEGVAALQQLAQVALVEGACDDQDDVVDHVPVGDVIQERRERLHGVELHVLELVDHLVDALLLDDRGLQRPGLVLQEVAVVCLREVELHVLERLALTQVRVVVYIKKLGAEAAEDGLEVPVLAVERKEPRMRPGLEQPINNRCHLSVCVCVCAERKEKEYAFFAI